MDNLIVVNMFAGPGAGKSTMATSVYSELKWLGVNCEYVSEYAKDKVWEGSSHVLDNQLYVFGKQVQRLHRLVGKVSVAVTDSPILLSLVYKNPIIYSASFDDVVIETHNRFDNLNYFLQREKPYQTSGRLQKEEEAINLDTHIEMVLEYLKCGYTKLPCIKQNVNLIVSDIIYKLKTGVV